MPGATATHHLTLYRAPSGALVFGAGTVQWAWGLDNITTGKSTDRTMQQATVNLLADMGGQPRTLMRGLSTATRSTDTTPPTSWLTSPVAGAAVADGSVVTITGSASDTGGVVAGVEVSTDGGTTWHPARGTTNWSYDWVAHGSPSTTIERRAVDDSGNLETPTTGTSVKVACPCSIWRPGTAPAVADSGEGRPLEVGVKFTSDVAGSISGIRFYKAPTSTGPHIANLWSASGQLLASAVFSGESRSGWQQVTFSSPVPIAIRTTYVASDFAPYGHQSADANYFYGPPQAPDRGPSVFSSPPLHAVRSTPVTPNGTYIYTAASAFPTSSYQASNYWVDPVFVPTTGSAPK